MNFAEIAYRQLNPVTKAAALTILGNANRLLKKWAQLVPGMKFRTLRNTIFSNPQTISELLPEELRADFYADLSVIVAVRQPQNFLNGNNVEEAVLEGHAALAKRHANKWAKTVDHMSGLEREDYLQEAYMQIVESMYHWNPEGGADITTYLWYALKNRLSNVKNQQGSFLSRLANSSIVLLDKYNKAKNKAELGTSFEQITEELGLSNKEKRHLSDLLTKAVAESSMKAEDNDEASDYTALRSGIDQQSETETFIQNENVKEILDRAGLTPIERELIETAMNPYHGWQKAVGEKYIAPRTGKPYGRMRITQILVQARAKVAKAMARTGVQV
jgi:DNA-directed RNA polymerase specialized sigma24 family protein